MSNSSNYSASYTPETVTENFSLKGKSAVITGGGGFLGYYFALSLGQAGSRIHLVDRNPEGLQQNADKLSRAGIGVDCHESDLGQIGDVTEMVQSIIASAGRINILINGAAFAMKSLQQEDGDFFADVEEYESNLWQKANDFNLNSVFNVSQKIGRHMKDHGGGSIINIASDVGVISPDHRIYQKDETAGYDGVEFNTPLSYAASKAAIISMTRYLATYWANDGIRVNSVSPCGVFNNQDDQFIQQLERCIPMGRMLMPEELMGPVLFLASNASNFVTGHNLVVDGGRTIW